MHVNIEVKLHELLLRQCESDKYYLN